MKFPPVDTVDLVALGMAFNSVISCDDSTATVSPQPPRLVSKLLAAAMASPPPAERMSYMRHVRDLLMSITDYTQAADSPLSPEDREAWRVYRQALRDLPSVYIGEGPIPWPVAPG